MLVLEFHDIKADCFIALISGTTGCVFCWFHLHVVPFRRSMATLCSCWKARWWWSIWGWSWGLRWSSATTSTSSSRAGRDPPPPLRCRRRHGRLYRHAFADCAWQRGLDFGEIVWQTPACSHFRCIEGTNGRDLLSVCPLSESHRCSPNYQKPPRCTEIELWLFTDEVVSFPSLLSGLTKSFGL